MKQKKKIETSKLILLVSYINAITLTLLVVIGTFMQINVTDLKEVTIVSWGEVAASNIWYFTKAKVENRLKIIGSLSKEFKDQVDINQILNL